MSEFPDFLHQPVDEVAKRLLGCVLERELDGQIVKVRIVETESYDENDEASHSYSGQRNQNAVMFGPAGHLYVYFTYGMHYCCNVVTGEKGYGAGVLIRAVEPITSKDLLEKRRGIAGVNALNGPAKLTKALGIDKFMGEHDLRLAPLRLLTGSLRPGEVVQASPRIGISRAKDLHRRYFIAANAYVSR